MSTFRIIYGWYLWNTWVIPMWYSCHTAMILGRVSTWLTFPRTCCWQRLYSVGARKIFLFGVGPLGCIPSQIYQNNSPNGACVEFINSDVRLFNEATRVLARELTASLPGATVVYGNVYSLVSDIIANPATYGKSLEPAQSDWND